MEKIIDFGRTYKGETLSQCPEKYLKWLASHESRLLESNRWASRNARKLLEKKEEKAMLQAVRSEAKGYGFDWQESLKDTVLANREAVFSLDEMYTALQSVCKSGEYLESKERVARRLDGLSERTCQIRLQKIGESYKFAYVG
jgi:hypothetical protein